MGSDHHLSPTNNLPVIFFTVQKSNAFKIITISYTYNIKILKNKKLYY